MQLKLSDVLPDALNQPYPCDMFIIPPWNLLDFDRQNIISCQTDDTNIKAAQSVKKMNNSQPDLVMGTNGSAIGR